MLKDSNSRLALKDYGSTSALIGYPQD